MLKVAQKPERWLFRYRVSLLWCGFGAAAASLYWLAVARARPIYVIQDVMVNYADGVVRRGLLGEGVRAAMGLAGGGAGLWAWALICLLASMLFGLSARIFRALPDNPALLPLVLAPWGLLFFTYDAEGSFRKELLGYLALALVLQGALAVSPRRATGWVLAGCAAFVVAVFAHEGVVVLWPVFAMGVWVVALAQPSRFGGLAPAALAALATGALAALALVWLATLPPRDISAICAAVGVDACGGPFAWLNAGAADGWAYVYKRRNWDEVAVYATQALLCLVPFLGLYRAGTRPGLRAALLALPFMAIIPLFFLGYDWGRWIQMAFFPTGLVACAGIATGLVSYRRVLPPWLALAYVGSWSIAHAGGTLAVKGLWLWPALAVLTALVGLRRWMSAGD